MPTNSAAHVGEAGRALRGTRIGLLLPTLSGGGAEPVVVHWAEALAAAGALPILLTWQPQPRNMPSQPSTVPAAAFEGGSGLVGKLRLIRWLRGQAKELDILVGNLTYGNLLALVAAFGLPNTRVVAVEHTALTGLLRTQGSAGRAKLALVAPAYRRAHAVVACSHAVAADLVSRHKVSDRKLYVVPNAVLRGILPVSKRETMRVRIVFAGRHVPEKRPELVLKTAVELRDRGYSVTALFFGSGSLTDALRSEAQELGIQASFPGWDDNWTRTYARGDCLLLPSITEGFGNVLVEAAAARYKVVAPATALGVGDAIIPFVTGVPALSARPRHLADAVEAAVQLSEVVSVQDWLSWYSLPSSSRRFAEVLRTICDEPSR